MNLCSRFISRCLQGLLILGLMVPLSLRAQLDPRLQITSTDFLDLYQQSSTVKVKPEIMTLFDFSGSMRALMFHPAYRNVDISDAGFPGESLTFTLTPGAAASQVYKVRATTMMDPQVYTEMTVTVGQTGVTVTNAGANRTDSINTNGSRRSLWTSISNMTINTAGTITNGTTYTFSAMVTLACNASKTSSAPGNALSEYVAKSGSMTLVGGINWTVTGFPGATSGMTTTPAPTTSSNFWTSLAQTFQWTAVTGTATPAAISAAFSSFSATCVQLVKPNGTVVTAADADAASTTLYGGSASPKSSDVRNWVRAASHARFTYSDGSVARTVDIPIPWKVLDLTSTGSPLSSATVSDAVKSITNPDGTITSWGSGQNIEVDQAYKVTGGSEMLSGGSTTQTSTTLNHTGYHTTYLTWIFTGKYADGLYPNKYIVYDAADASIVGGQDLATWGQGFGAGIPGASTITVPSYGEALNTATRPYLGNTTVTASSYILPSKTRVQAVKQAAIASWIKYQNDVLWAIRFIGSGGTDTMTNNSATAMNNTATPDATAATFGTDTAWTLLNGNSLNGMQRISYLLEQTDTPLTYAVSRSLAQFTDPNNVFNAVETGANKASQCMAHNLIVFTDGADNVGTLTNTSPYLVPSGTTGLAPSGNAWDGNAGIIAHPSYINQGAGGTNYWNLYTFAAIGAHLSDSSVMDGAKVSHYMLAPSSYPSASSTRDAFLPYSIIQRGTPSTSDNVKFDKPHRITTMTVGVSLGGTYLDPNSPKYRLFAAAAIGDPTTQSWNLNNLAPFDSIQDPNDSSRRLRKPGTTNFFDGSDPTTLAKSLDVAIQQTLLPSNINSTTNPNLPFIGAALGEEVYLGKFQPPANGGVIWPGDLMMFGTRQVNGQTQIVDKTDNLATTVDTSTAIWATSTVMAARNWSLRKLFTRIPGNATTPEPGLSSFTDLGTAYSSSTTGLKNFVATSYSTDLTRQRVIQFAAGGDTTGAMDTTLNPNGRPVANRPSIMGDIINSSPGFLEYNLADVTSSLPTTLSSKISTTTGVTNHFRLLLVGTNQGWLHAFGEVSNISKVLDPADTTHTKMVDHVTAGVDELWAFMPTDFLANLDYITQAGNSHQFMADGTPAIYFLDLPPSSGGSGNGVLDWGSGHDPTTTKERAIAIVGLRKGGRSYYALDIHDPFNPAMKWALVPDEADSFPQSRIASGGPALATVKTILKNWGFSTCTPGLGRIMFSGVLRDAVFLGGGFSVPEIEANFPDASGKATPLGRSVIALDVYTGEVLAAVDMTGASGPITAGLVPFEFFLNSGMAQRSYFLDYAGGLWSWGSQATSSLSAYTNYRTDSSELSSWSVRKVAQDGTGKNALYSTLPAPFRVGTFPGQGLNGAPSPAAVGIATISGDRNNPLDYYSSSTNKPSQHRLTVVFDRQDHKAWDASDGAVTDSSLLNAGAWAAPATTTSAPTASSSLQAGDPLITPGSQTYYLAPHDALGNYSTPKLGYYASLPPLASGFIPKGMNTPLVVASALFYSYFSPETADPCLGGSGHTYANLICDVLNPILSDTRTTVSCTSGTQFTWTGVASDFVTIGTQGVLQAGVVLANNPSTGQSLTTIELKTILGNRLEKYPKVRTWRTIH